jgi:hypothetical protein
VTIRRCIVTIGKIITKSNDKRGKLASPSLILMIMLCFSLLSFPTGVLHSQEKFGFGIILGEPTGVAWKYKISRLTALDGAIGFSPHDRFRAHVDYLWHSYPFHEQNLALHYGVGAAIGFGQPDYVVFERGNRYFLRHADLGFGARTVLGLTYDIPRSPVDLFFELAPILIAAPETGVGVDIGIGARVYP